MAKHKTPVQWGNSVGCLDFSENRKRKCCVGHPLWTSSNQWRKTRWSRLWEFLGHRSNVNINRKTQQFIAGDLLQFHWMFCCPPKKNMLEKHKRLYNGEFCWVSGFLGKSKTEALCCTLLVDFVQPAPKWVRKNEMENHGYLEMLENSKVTYELECNLKRYSCIINPKRYSCIRFSKEILLYLIFKKRILLHREIHKLGSMPDFNRRIQHHHVKPKGNQSAIKNLTKSNECKSKRSWSQS